jgi:hypothetical protein
MDQRSTFRVLGELFEEGADQLFMAKMREQKKKEREAQWAAEDAAASNSALKHAMDFLSNYKTAGGANFPPISGPTCMSGITTSSQQEEKIKRAPPLPAKEDDALGSMDIDKVAGFIQEVLRRSTRESTVEKADHIKQLYDEAVISDRRQKVISNLIGSAITAGGTAGIASGISGKSVGSGLLMGGLGALSGALFLVAQLLRY